MDQPFALPRYSLEEIASIIGPPVWMPAALAAAIARQPYERVVAAIRTGALRGRLDQDGGYEVSTDEMLVVAGDFEGPSPLMLQWSKLVPRPRFSLPVIEALVARTKGRLRVEDVAQLTGQTEPEVDADMLAGRLLAIPDEALVDEGHSEWAWVVGWIQLVDEAGHAVLHRRQRDGGRGPSAN
jgi:hypothetical protein